MDDDHRTLNGIYKEIAEECGLEVAKQIHKTFKGMNISFPMKFYCRLKTIELIKTEYTGSNIRELAKKYGYSDRWIRMILKKSDEEVR